MFAYMRKYGTGKNKILFLRKTGVRVLGRAVSGITMMTTEFDVLTSYFDTNMVINNV